MATPPKSIWTEEESNSKSPVPAMLVAGSVVGGMMALTLPFVMMPALGKNLPYMATPAVKLQRALSFIQQRTGNNSTRTKCADDTMMIGAAAAAAAPHCRSFLDLGSGDGEAVYQAVKLLDVAGRGDSRGQSLPYYQSCTGIELNSTLYLLSHVRRALFWTRDERARSRFVCRDFFGPLSSSSSNGGGGGETNLMSNATTILIFGIQPLMRPISETLALHNLRPGTHVLSYRFELPVAADGNPATTTTTTTLQDHGGGDADGGGGDSKSSMRVSDEEEPPPSLNLLQATLIYDVDEMRIYECTSSQQVCDRATMTTFSTTR